MATQKVTTAQDPTLASKLATEAIQAVNQEVVSVSEESDIQLPPDTTVELPGGLFDPIDGTVKTAEVRELNGSDEEAIAKAADMGKGLLMILERATVLIGDKKPSREDLDSLLAGDREMLLLAIRKATFGEVIKLGPGACPHCEEEQIFEVNLTKDVKVKALENDERSFAVDCKIGEVRVNLPDGGTQKEIVNSNNKTSAELDTLLLKSCIATINGLPVMSANQVRDLSINDRRKILNAISDRNPGPQLSEVKKNCQACGQEVPLPLTLADLF
jgi:hypothetical protein